MQSATDSGTTSFALAHEKKRHLFCVAVWFLDVSICNVYGLCLVCVSVVAITVTNTTCCDKIHKKFTERSITEDSQHLIYSKYC